MFTDLDRAASALRELATRAETAAANLQPSDEAQILPIALAEATGDRLDLMAQCCSALGANDFRADVNRLLASPRAAGIPAQQRANLEAGADAMDAIKQTLANYGQSIRDAAAAM